MTNTTRNWKTTTMGVLMILGYVLNAITAYLQSGALPSLEAATIAIGTGIGFIMAKDGDKTGIVRLLILAPACLMLASCTTDPVTGEKAFFGVTSKSFQAELKDIGLQLANATTQAAAQAVLNVAEVKLNEATAKLAANTDTNPLVVLALTKGVDQAQSLVVQARLKVAAFRFGKQPVDVQP
jgi:hypothetical protein